MKTENHSIHEVLAINSTSFFIPPFQRAYAWGKPEIERYFSDILRIIDSERDPNQHDKLEHFFGTLVIKEEKAGFAHRSVVVDGQQRLTTTLLFLIALRDLESDSNKKDYITYSYLLNNSSTYQDKIKLKQVTKDWESYRSLVTKVGQAHGMIKNAYQIFTKLISDNKIKMQDVAFEHYITAIQRMNVAVIFLDERPFKGEDPQIIFETLNSLGRPLTLSDLVRNYVLLNMDSNNQSQIFENTWHPKIEAVLNEKTSEFFRDYLQFKKNTSIKVVRDNNTKEVYQLFKNFVEERFNFHKEFIDDIVRYVNWYKWIITENNYELISTNNSKNNIIIELLRNIFHDIKSEAFKPFVLGLLEFHQEEVNGFRIDDELLISILKTIRTYLIRRRIIGLTQGENKNIVLLCNRIKNLASGETTMFHLLSNLFYNLRYPNDNEVKNELISINFYEGLKKYSKFILGKIEENNTKVSVNFRDPKITIEHVMPQTLTRDWENELGLGYQETQKKYLHNIGNLILTEFNGEMGNKSFQEKKQKLEKSALSYRLDVIYKSSWNELSIIEHQKKMINDFLNTFPLPDDYKESNNWKSKEVEIMSLSFSPLDDDAGEIATGKTPYQILINDNLYEVGSWQEVFLTFLRFFKNNVEYDFDIIFDNQKELFGREETIVDYIQLMEMLEENSDYKTRYKTLYNAQFIDKINNPSDDLIFVHTNISANGTLNRLSSIMNKFNMSEDSVQILIR